MPVRLRITLLFTLLVFVILALVATSVYYFSYTSRTNTVKTRLTNRAITFGRLLSRSDIFSNELIRRIDSATSVAFINKVIEAYDYKDNKIYGYSSLEGDSLSITRGILDEARVTGNVYYTVGNRDVVAYHYTGEDARLVVIAAGEDFEGKENLKRLQKILMLSFSGGLVIAFLGGYFFSKGLLQPIKKIADEVNDISAQNFSSRIHTGRVKDEWYYLSDTLNALLDRLQQSFDMQKRFISNASHELSTPLTSISSQIEVSLQRERDAEQYRDVMRSVQQDVLHLTRLTQNLLQIAQASGTTGGIDITLIRIDDVLFSLPTEVSKIDKAYAVFFKLDRLPEDEGKLLVFGNEELLSSALKNIIVNACKYSNNNVATVTLKVEKDDIIISVKDEGIGIPENELSKIFQPFYRADDKVKDGFGLGLSLALRIIKMHKGEINATSVVGKGSVFTITLPVAKTNFH